MYSEESYYLPNLESSIGTKKKFMKKFLFILLILALSDNSFSQIVIGSKYNPMTFDEMMKPLQIAEIALKNAAEKFELNMNKGAECWKKGNYVEAKYYIKKCQEINNDFKGRFCNPNDIAKTLADCDRMIKKQNDIEEQNKNTTGRNTTGDNYKLYSNSLYSIFYPADWKYKENINEMTDVYIGSESKGIGFTIVRIFTATSLEEANKEAISNAHMNGIAVSDNKLIRINGVNCYRNILNMSVNGIKVKQISYTLKKGDYLYNIKFGNDEKVVNAYLATIESIINSLNFN